jgi:hypothetical protein
MATKILTLVATFHLLKTNCPDLNHPVCAKAVKSFEEVMKAYDDSDKACADLRKYILEIKVPEFKK